MFAQSNQVANLEDLNADEDEPDLDTEQLKAKLLVYKNQIQDKDKLLENQQIQLNKLNIQNKAKRVQLNKLKFPHEEKEEGSQNTSPIHDTLLVTKRQLEECQQELATSKQHISLLENNYQQLFNSQKSSDHDSKNKNIKVTGQQEMFAQMVYKDTKILQLNNKILEQERLMMDLKENINEKDEVLSVRDKAIQLMTEDLSLRGKNVMDQLEETKLHMKDMQESFADMEIEWKVKEQMLKDELAAKTEVISQLSQHLGVGSDKSETPQTPEAVEHLVSEINQNKSELQLADIVENNFCNEECRKLMSRLEVLAGQTLNHDTCFEFITQVLKQQDFPAQEILYSDDQQLVLTENSEHPSLNPDSSQEKPNHQSIIDSLINQVDSLNSHLLSQQEENQYLFQTNSDLSHKINALECEKEDLIVVSQEAARIQSELTKKDELLTTALREIKDYQTKLGEIKTLIHEKLGLFKNNLETSLKQLKKDSQDLKGIVKSEGSFYSEKFELLTSVIDKYKKDLDANRKLLIRELSQLIELIVDESKLELSELINNVDGEGALFESKLQTFISTFSDSVRKRIQTSEDKVEYFTNSQEKLESLNCLQNVQIEDLKKKLEEIEIKFTNVQEINNQTLLLEQQKLSKKIKELEAALATVYKLNDSLKGFESCKDEEKLDHLKHLESKANVLDQQLQKIEAGLSSNDFNSLEKCILEFGKEKNGYQKELESLVLKSKQNEDMVKLVKLSLEHLNGAFKMISEQVYSTLQDKSKQVRNLENEITTLHQSLSTSYSIIKESMLDHKLQDVTVEEIMEELPKELEHLVEIRDNQFRILKERIKDLEENSTNDISETERLKEKYFQAKSTVETLKKECNELKGQLLELTPSPQIEEDYNELQISFEQLNTKYKDLKDQQETHLQKSFTSLETSPKHIQMLKQNEASAKSVEELEHQLAIQKLKFEKVLLKCKTLKDEYKQLQQTTQIEKDNLISEKTNEILLLHHEATKAENLSQKQNSTLRSDLEHSKGSILVLNSKISLLKDDYDRCLHDLKNSQIETQTLKGELETIKFHLGEAKNEKLMLEETVSEQKQRYLETENKNQMLVKKVEDLEEHSRMITNDNTVFQTLCSNLQTSKEELQKQLFESKKSDAIDNIKLYEEQIETLESEKASLSSINAELEKHKKEYLKQFNDLQSKSTEFEYKDIPLDNLDNYAEKPVESLCNDPVVANSQEMLGETEQKIEKLSHSNQELLQQIIELELKVIEFEAKEREVQKELMQKIDLETALRQLLADNQKQLTELEEQLAYSINQNEKYSIENKQSHSWTRKSSHDELESKGFKSHFKESKDMSIVNLEGAEASENFMSHNNESEFLSKSPDECCLVMEDSPEKPPEEGSGLLSFSASSLIPQRWWPTRNKRLF